MGRKAKIRKYRLTAKKEGNDDRISFGEPAILQIKTIFPEGEIVKQGAIFGVRLYLSPEFHGGRTTRTLFLARVELSTRGLEFNRFWEPWEIATDYIKAGPFDFRQIVGTQAFECWDLTIPLSNCREVLYAFRLVPVSIDPDQSLLEAVPSARTRLAKLGVFAQNNVIPLSTYVKHYQQIDEICTNEAGREVIATVGLKTAVADCLDICSIEAFERKQDDTSVQS